MTQTQQVYRLELTEREKDTAISALQWEAESSERDDLNERASRMYALADKLRALEPVGTEGGS